MKKCLFCKFCVQKLQFCADYRKFCADSRPRVRAFQKLCRSHDQFPGVSLVNPPSNWKPGLYPCSVPDCSAWSLKHKKNQKRIFPPHFVPDYPRVKLKNKEVFRIGRMDRLRVLFQIFITQSHNNKEVFQIGCRDHSRNQEA